MAGPWAFRVSVVVALVFLVLDYFRLNQNEKRDVRMLKVAYWFNTSIKDRGLDPVLVNSTHEANLLINLYDRLLEFNQSGSLVPALAEEIFWNGNDIHFKIRKNVRTADGHLIDVNDVLFSLKRLMIIGTHTHGDLKSFLCPTHTFKTIGDACPGIKVENEELVLTAEQPHKAKFLIPLLASVDFSIIPRTSIDLQSLKITDYKNTSGPYYLERDDARGNFLFAVNANHYKVSAKIPQKVQFVSAPGKEMLGLLNDGAVDLFTTTEPNLTVSEREAFRHSDSFSYYETDPIKLWFVKFFKKSTFNLTSENRITIGKEIKKRFLEVFKEFGLMETVEAFPSHSEASLTEDQVGEIKDFIKRQNNIGRRKPNFAIGPGNAEVYRTFLNSYTGVKVVDYTDSTKIWHLPEAESPDVVTNYVDAAFNEDISLISYNIYSGAFDMTREEGIKWLEDYMKIDDKGERLKKFRQLHLDVLKKGYIFPIGFTSYTAVVRKPWRFEMPTMYAGTYFWLIKRD